jgi:hypothetical protein
VGTAGRGWTAVLLLSAVLSVHGLPCGSADVEATHAGPPAAVAQMAEEEVADAIALAEAVRDPQNAEITEMQHLLTRFGG